MPLLIPGTGSGLPERLVGSIVARSLPASASVRRIAVVGGAGELPPAALAALASVAVEDRLALEAEITGPEADHLGPSAAGQDEDQQDRPVAPATHGVGDDREEAAHLVGAVSPGDRGDGPRAFEGVAGVGGQEAHPDREAVEGGETGDPGADRRR